MVLKSCFGMMCGVVITFEDFFQSCLLLPVVRMHG
jgi:hypothetical protein